MSKRFIYIEVKNGHPHTCSFAILDNAKKRFEEAEQNEYPVAIYDWVEDELMLDNQSVLGRTLGETYMIDYCREALQLDGDYDFGQISTL